MIAEIIERLRDVAELKLVAGLAEWSALDAPPLLMPACYVTPYTTDTTPNGLAAGGFRQSLTETAQIFTIVRNLRDARGAAAALDLVALRDLVRVRLVGWKPGTDWEQLELGAGRLFEMEDGVAVWRDLVSARSTFFVTP